VQRRLMRNQINMVTATTSKQLVGPNDGRYALIISCAASHPAYISFGQPASGTSGLFIPTGGGWQVLLYDHIGQALREEIYVATPGGTDNIACLDIFEANCSCLNVQQDTTPMPAPLK